MFTVKLQVYKQDDFVLDWLKHAQKCMNTWYCTVILTLEYSIFLKKQTYI